MSHAQVGDPVRLGTCIGYSLEMSERMGRLVAIRHNVKPIQTYVIRKYAKGDGEWPTGEYVTTSLMALQPHALGPDGECKESRMASFEFGRAS